MTNIEVSLHPLENLILQLWALNFEHDLERESFQERKLLPVIITMLKNRDPDLQRVVWVLAIDLVQAETVVHALLYEADVLVISDFKPVV